MNSMQNITVYCGSNLGLTPDYYYAAKQMGKAIAKRGSHLVYGGGSAGLMGVLADSVLEHGGLATGVIPHFLDEKEVAHKGLTKLIMTETMSQRKLKMIELADAYIAMAGGLGTYEELFEVLSNAQLELDNSPIGLLNTNGFFNPLLNLLKNTADCGFMPADNLKLVCVSDDPEILLNQMAHYIPTKTIKWQHPDWYDELIKNPKN